MVSDIMITQAENQNIARELSSLGCGPRESAVYIFSLQSGPATVQQIARQIGCNRVTAHDAVEKLIEKGILFETRKGKRRLLVAEPPSVFQQLLQRKRSELDLVEERIGKIITKLEALQATDDSVPAVKFYEEVSGFKKMLEETLSAQGEVLVFTNVELFSQLLDPDYLENYFLRRARRGIHTRLIFPQCAFAERVIKRAIPYKIDVRLVPAKYQWQSGVFAWNDCLALKSFTKGKVTCTIVQNEDIAFFYRNVVFDLLWDSLEA